MKMKNGVERWLRKIGFKTENFSDFLGKGSKLFDSVIVDGNKRIFEKVVVCV